MIDISQPILDEFKNIFFVKGERNGGYPYSNSLLIEDYLIDTGISSKHLRKLKRNFSINHVILSHWHEDHISGNRLLKNARFLCHREDKHIVEDIYKMIPYYGLTNTIAEDMLIPIIEGFKIKNTKIDKTIEDNNLIKINDYQLKVIHTPGHTAGHCCFYEESSKIAFLADIDLTNFIFYGGIDSNLIDYEKSIEKVEKLLLPQCEIAISAHKGVFQGKKLIKEELKNYKLIIHKNDERLLSHLSERKPINSQDLTEKNIIYKRYSEWKEFEIIAEKIMIEKHFEKFLMENLIEKTKNGYVLR
ncbi:MAG: MBL fold metallo-hydrolase [Promethearchaeota archaeon]